MISSNLLLQSDGGLSLTPLALTLVDDLGNLNLAFVDEHDLSVVLTHVVAHADLMESAVRAENQGSICTGLGQGADHPQGVEGILLKLLSWAR